MAEWSETDLRKMQPDPGTTEVPAITVPVNGLTRYLRARLEVIGGVMRWDVPRALLGVIPIGRRHVSVPVGEVESLRLRRTLRPLNFVAGAALIGVPLVLTLWWAAIPLGLAGLWVVMVSLGPRLEAATHSGAVHHANVCFGHQIDAELYMEAVGDLADQARNAAKSGSVA